MMSRKLPLPLFSLSLLLLLFVASPAISQAASPDGQQPATSNVAAASAPADQSTAVASRCQRCGDGYCARSCENEFSCPADCAPQTSVAARCGKCGDGQCVRSCGETPESCPVDCGGTPDPSATTATNTKDCEANTKKADVKKD